MRLGRLSRAALATVTAAVAVCAPAAADREQVRLVAADVTLAHHAVVRLADLGDPTGWTGGGLEPPAPTSFQCGSYMAKQSDLVLTGNAASKWSHSGLEFDSEAQVLRTRTMVELDWKRTITHTGVVECLRQKFASGLPAGQKLVSFVPMAFPKIAKLSAAFRGLVDVTSGATTVRVLVDVVVVAAGRVELTLITTAPYSARAPVLNAELRLAQVMAARAQPGAA